MIVKYEDLKLDTEFQHCFAHQVDSVFRGEYVRVESIVGEFKITVERVGCDIVQCFVRVLKEREKNEN